MELLIWKRASQPHDVSVHFACLNLLKQNEEKDQLLKINVDSDSMSADSQTSKCQSIIPHHAHMQIWMVPYPMVTVDNAICT